MHVDLEVTYALRGEGMGDGLSLSSVFGSVACIEEASLDGNEYIVVFSEVWSE